MDKLPDDFNLIIVGTGLVESILSAAASRVGKTVLHIDTNRYYGRHWASFNLDTLQKICEQSDPIKPPVDQNLVSFRNDIFNIKDFTFRWLIPREHIKNGEPGTTNDVEKEDEKEAQNESWTQEKLEHLTRKFNIDLAPKLQYAKGDLVELLISSNIARYSEYRSVSRVLVWLNRQLEIVPCSRSDVFTNNKVSVIEKRMLMKLLSSLDKESEVLKKYEKKSFREFLKDKKLTPNLIHYVLYAISIGNDKTPCHEGVKNTKRFLNSLGRFGKTPFLFSMYGSGDITQAFCRLSAVFGGTFALDQTIHGIRVEENKFKSITVGNQEIKGENLVMTIELAPEIYVKSVEKKYISRCILITDKSVMASEKQHLTLLLYPPENGKSSTIIIELGNLTGTCPAGLYLVHLITEQKESPENDFEHILSNLFAVKSNLEPHVIEEKPRVLGLFYFSLPNTNDAKFENTPSNIFITPGPDLDLDYDVSVQKAKQMFENLYPDLEFLPRAPDPEEIVIEGEN